MTWKNGKLLWKAENHNQNNNLWLKLKAVKAAKLLLASVVKDTLPRDGDQKTSRYPNIAVKVSKRKPMDDSTGFYFYTIFPAVLTLYILLPSKTTT